MRILLRSGFILTILTLFQFVASAAEIPFSLWLDQPVTRLFAASYLTQNEGATEPEKVVAFISLLEKSLLDQPPIRVTSLEHYLRIRNQNATSMQDYISEVKAKGIVNPLNIITPNGEIYEQILNYEIDQLQNVLRQTLPYLPQDGRAALEINSAIDSMNLLLKTYHNAIGLRDGLEMSTRSWKGLPILGLMRAVGEHLVTPIMNSVTYSAPVMNQFRNRLRAELAELKARVPQDLQNWKSAFHQFQANVLEAAIHQSLNRGASTEWFLKPIQAWSKADLMNIGNLFFNSLPQSLQQDVVWYAIQNHDNLKQPLSLLSEYPQSSLILNHFRNWIQRPEIKIEFQKITELPVSEVMYSFSMLLKNSLSGSENKSSPQELDQVGSFNFYAIDKNQSLSLSEQSAAISLSEYSERNPRRSDLLKRKLAAVILQHAFEGGLTTLLSRDVLVVEGQGGERDHIYISAISPVESFPVDSSRRFIEALSDLPLKQLVRGTGEDSIDLYQSLDENDKVKISEFLRQPENLRWAIQLDQLRQMVGEKILKSEIRFYVLKHPKYIFQFLKARWFHRTQASDCRFLFN